MADNNLRLWEAILYEGISSFPFVIFVLYSFRGHWRFGKRATYIIVCTVFLFQMTLSQIELYLPSANHLLFNITRSGCYVGFIFFVLKEHLGKLVFTVLTLSDLSDFAVFCGKCLKGIFFPEYSSITYHFTFSLFMLLVLVFELPLVYLLVFRNICTHGETAELEDQEKAGDFMWRYLWLVPAVFYMISMQFFYGSPSSGQRDLSDPKSTLYLFFVDAGSIMIYHIVIRTADLYQRNSILLKENHALTIQRLQYDSLNERLEKMRRTRHDIRHHAALLKEIRDSGDISTLDGLISMYTEQNRLDEPLIFCENEAVNIVFALYSETAYQNGIAFSVKADIPNDIFVDKKDLVVLFGNLLENAADACKEVGGDRFIDLTAAYTYTQNKTHRFSLIVKNSCGIVSRDDEGVFRSIKHAGDGIGISSVKNITDKYSGACSFTPEGSNFTVSVILYEQQNDLLSHSS